jgi:hypothetical protein
MPYLSWSIVVLLTCVFTLGCATHRPDRSQWPLTIAVGPVTFEAPVTKSKQIHTFEENPDDDADRQLLPILIDEIEVRAQRFLTEELAKIPGIHVIPFEQTRLLLPDLRSSRDTLADAQVQALGRQTGADHVVTGLIHDYGRVRWQYWVTGWLAHAVVEMSIVGILSGWNPAALGAYAAVDFTTDMVLWYGGAEVFGWAFRPVRLHLDAVQVKSCPGKIWSRDELVIRVPGKRLEEFPADQQHLKQVQLEANLHQAAQDVAAEAAEVLEIQPCSENGEAKPLPSFSWASLFDLLL